MKIKTEGKWMWEEPDQPNPASGGNGICESHRAANELAPRKTCPVCDLAAEREKFRKYSDLSVSIEGDLRAQLKTLVDALKTCRSQLKGGDKAHPLLPIIDAVLTKEEQREMAEVTVETGVTDERCPRCGSRICLDYYCEFGHPQPRPK